MTDLMSRPALLDDRTRAFQREADLPRSILGESLGALLPARLRLPDG